MNEEMKFPKTFEEFIKQYSFFDKQQIYTNGSELIQVFRIKQWEEHKEKENQELKQKYLNAVADYGNVMFEKEQLKKQLEKVLNDYCRLDAYNRTQQEEFISYLENKIKRKRLNATCTNEYNDYFISLKVALQKYRSIIGVSDENNKQ